MFGICWLYDFSVNDAHQGTKRYGGRFQESTETVVQTPAESRKSQKRLSHRMQDRKVGGESRKERIGRHFSFSRSGEACSWSGLLYMSDYVLFYLIFFSFSLYAFSHTEKRNGKILLIGLFYLNVVYASLY